jgi:phthiodiolone/phenolphthiodiolone dimycocerosates ketoreductase
MPTKIAETAGMLWPNRSGSVASVIKAATRMRDSGVVDGVIVSDQTTHLTPPFLWNADNAAMADIVPDLDSFDDAFITGTIAAVGAPGLTLTISSDSVRRNPAELSQTMMTLAKVAGESGGRAMFHIGAGEIKQCKPFGHKRSQGTDRLEDLARIFTALWDADGPIDLEGKYTTLRQAYMGAARPYRPELWALGGGEKLIDIATSYCDGLSVSTPCVWPTPEHAADAISKIKADLERKGRDPEQFGIGIYGSVLCHDDPNEMDHLLDNELVRWWAAMFGRIQGQQWRDEGFESPIPDGWAYFAKLLPYETEPAFVEEVLSKTTRAITEAAYHYGTPEQVGDEMAAYADAGVTWIMPCDWTPSLLTPQDAKRAVGRTIEMCARVKGKDLSEVTSESAR